jgi:hypothetical protein
MIGADQAARAAEAKATIAQLKGGAKQSSRGSARARKSSFSISTVSHCTRLRLLRRLKEAIQYRHPAA